MSVIAEGDERAVEKLCVHDAVAHSGVDERREISKGMIKMIRQIPSCVARAEAFLGIGRRSRNVKGETIV